jgi:hypothetical protein
MRASISPLGIMIRWMARPLSPDGAGRLHAAEGAREATVPQAGRSKTLGSTPRGQGFRRRSASIPRSPDAGRQTSAGVHSVLAVAMVAKQQPTAGRPGQPYLEGIKENSSSLRNGRQPSPPPIRTRKPLHRRRRSSARDGRKPDAVDRRLPQSPAHPEK